MLGDRRTARRGKEMLRPWIGWVQQGPERHRSQQQYYNDMDTLVKIVLRMD